MRILVFSLGVVFKKAVQGGSQKVLRDIAVGLAQRGHKITIVCPMRKDNNKIFEFCRGAVVKPILPLREAFPMPYAVSPFSLTESYRIIEEEIKDADLLYCHDGGLLFETLKNRVPTVISLRDYCYQETLLGAMNFQGDAVVVNSMHTYLSLQDSFMQINPYLRGKVRIIYNGYDSNVFQPRNISESFYRKYGLFPKSNELIIGFPHRPEFSKGFQNALQVLKKLTETWGKRIKLLIPMYMDRGLSDRTDNTYHQAESIIEDLQLQDNVIYHDWVSHEEMPEYYSYCDVVLCIGNFVESFSNVSVEALLCGTPVVSANTSTYRTIPIRPFLHIVPYGEINETAGVVHEILCSKDTRALTNARSFISKEFTIKKMVDAYEQVFLQVLKEKETGNSTEVLCELNAESDLPEKYKLAAWCEVVDGKIYNDYLGEYLENPLGTLLSGHEQAFTKQELLCCGVDKEIIEQACADGILVVAG